MEFLGYVITPIMLLGAWISGGILERRHLKNPAASRKRIKRRAGHHDRGPSAGLARGVM